MSMSAAELEACQEAHKNLSSDTHTSKNYIFMEPVDLREVPNYLQVIQRPMDLSTLGKNLNSGAYASKEQFFADARLIFQNALVFHKGNKATQWIVKLAREMLKLVTKEEKAVEKKLPKSKPSLKLKLSSKATSEAAAPSKPKLSIKLGKAGADAAATTTAAKPKKPKLKLSLSTKATGAAKKQEAKPAAAVAPPPRAPSRGKELPKGVTTTSPPKPKPPAKPKKKAVKKKKTPAPPAPPASSQMTEARKAQCFKVLAGLKRRQAKNVGWFHKPISDKQFVDDYRAKIPIPMDLGTMYSKLEKNSYTSVADFIWDLRRTFGNCLRYNTSIHDSFRPVAVEMQTTSEELLAYFLQDVPYPKLLYCWKLCVTVLDALLNLTNASDGHQTAHYFLHPVSFYCNGSFPADYLTKVKQPMDFGTVTSKLMEGMYQSATSFAADCRLVLQNCLTYYSGREDGVFFCEQARTLQSLMSQQLDALLRYDQSPNGARAAALANAAVPRPPKPPKDLLLGYLKELRSLVYTDKFTKLSEPAMRAFEKPVDLTLYPDYLQYVKIPMDLGTVEARVKSNAYETIEDFEYDVNLIFRNAEAYNAPRRNEHLMGLAKFCTKNFRKILAHKLTKPEDKQVKRDAPASQPPTKKIKLEAPVSTGKTVPRISITASAAAAAKTMQRTKSPKPTQKKKDNKQNQPVPLHVAIAQLKAGFPLRRQYKYLQPWEQSCARFFRELMRHAWISAARPKFIFHVPVPVLFPDLQEAYSAKIVKPMDLTTVEAKLLQGGLYRGPQDLVDDTGLVFSNAITFNRAGRDAGDLLSCAYYDASVHLLRYTRWLSLELLSPYFGEDEPPEKPQEGEPTLSSWKLTASNKTSARTEMEELVLKEPLDKSIEGDRYTWMEAECEKLLKALRHQSDARQMTYFLMSNFPADYAAFISKPMDWDRVNRKLQRREYDTFGEVMEDLRLIFSNALKYNARAKGTDSVSGQAYDAAIYMSAKLETAIDKMILSVSDRLERERIEHDIAEREIDAAQRAEEERMRAEWTGAAGAKPQDTQVKPVEQTVRIITRRPVQRKEMRDFEFPYFDEDEGGHEQSYIDAMRLQKLVFEKQRQERKVMKETAVTIGAAVFARLHQRDAAVSWVEKLQKERAGPDKDNSSSKGQSNTTAAGSSVLAELSRGDRAQIKIAVAKKPKSKKRKRPPPLSL